MLSSLKNSVLKLEQLVATTEEWLLTVGMIIMISVGALQVVLRNFFNTGTDWGDMLVRALVLWLGFVGASLATRRGKHINIDVASKITSNPTFLRVRQKVIIFIALVMTALLLKFSINFTILEAGDSMTAFLNIPTWVVFIIVPISLFIMGVRLLLQLFVGYTLDKDAGEGLLP